MLSDMARAAGPQAMNNPAFQGMMMNALAQMIAPQLQQALQQAAAENPEGFSSLRARGTNPFVDWTQDSPNQARRRAMFGIGGPGGGAMPMGGADALGMSGDPSMERSAMGMSGCNGGGGGDDIGAMLNDGGLTVEDKITLMIMMIMKKMDQDIEKQANYINSLQQQQQGGGKGGGGKGGGGGGAPSIDVETMKLKRMIDKRSQMFDMLRQIIDKYNQTAKGIIDSMGR
jgi:hypothetical protein